MRQLASRAKGISVHDRVPASPLLCHLLLGAQLLNLL